MWRPFFACVKRSSAEMISGARIAGKHRRSQIDPLCFRMQAFQTGKYIVEKSHAEGQCICGQLRFRLADNQSYREFYPGRDVISLFGEEDGNRWWTCATRAASNANGTVA